VRKSCAAFGCKLAHGHVWRQPQSDRGVLARIQVQGLFRTCFFIQGCSQKKLSAVDLMLPRIGFATALSSCFGVFRFAAAIETRRCFRLARQDFAFGTVDGRRACFTVHRTWERSLLFFQRPARRAASVTFVTSGDLYTRVCAWKRTRPPRLLYKYRKYR